MKNLLIFIPVFFAAIPLTSVIFIDLILVFFFFSIICSAVYILNDLKDLETDRLHPTKKYRRIARDEIVAKNEIRNLILLTGIALLGLSWISIASGILGLAYLINNLGYIYFFRKIPILDLLSLLVGFLIRLYLGSKLVKVPLSFWLIGLVCLIATSFILVKRRSDVILFQEGGTILRSTVHFYRNINLTFVISILLWCSVLFYGCYLQVVHQTFSSKNYAFFMTLVFSIIFVRSFLKDIHRFPHEDPLKLIFQNRMNLFLIVVSVVIFGYYFYNLP